MSWGQTCQFYKLNQIWQGQPEPRFPKSTWEMPSSLQDFDFGNLHLIVPVFWTAVKWLKYRHYGVKNYYPINQPVSRAIIRASFSWKFS